MNYTATEVVRKTGISYRRLDYWAREGVLVPSVRDASGSGQPKRLYSDEDVAKAACIDRLQRAGVSFATIRQRTPVGTLVALQEMLDELQFKGGVQDGDI